MLRRAWKQIQVRDRDRRSLASRTKSLDHFASWAAIFLATFLLVLVAARMNLSGGIVSANQDSVGNGGYVGSRTCATWHPSIYESFPRRDIGRSMSEINPSPLETMPPSASVFDSKLNRHFESYTREGTLYQSEYETAADGKEVFRDSRKVE